MPNVISFKIGTFFPRLALYVDLLSFYTVWGVIVIAVVAATATTFPFIQSSFRTKHIPKRKDVTVHSHSVSAHRRWHWHWHVISLNDFYLKRIILHQPWIWSQVAFIPFRVSMYSLLFALSLPSLAFFYWFVAGCCCCCFPSLACHHFALCYLFFFFICTLCINEFPSVCRFRLGERACFAHSFRTRSHCINSLSPFALFVIGISNGVCVCVHSRRVLSSKSMFTFLTAHSFETSLR